MAHATSARVRACFLASQRAPGAVGGVAWVLAGALTLAIGVPGCRSSAEPSSDESTVGAAEVVAVVDGTPIRGEAVIERVEDLRSSFAAPDGSSSSVSEMTAQLRVLDDLIDEALVSIAAERAGIVVLDEEIEQRVTQRGGLRPHAREIARYELLLDRLIRSQGTPPSDALVDRYYRECIAPEAFDGASVPPLEEVREELRASLGASLRASARSAILRSLRAEIAYSNDLALRYAGYSWDPPARSPTPVDAARAVPLSVAR